MEIGNFTMDLQKEKKQGEMRVIIKQETFSVASVACTSASAVNTSSVSTSTTSNFLPNQVTIKTEDCKPLVTRPSSTTTVRHTKTSQQSKSRRQSSPANIGGSLSRTKLEFDVQRAAVKKPSVGPSQERKLPASPGAPAPPAGKQPTRPTFSTTSTCNAERRPRRSSDDIPRKVPTARRHSVGTIQIEAQPLPQHIMGRRSSGPIQPRRKRQLGESEPFGFKFRKNNRHGHQQKRQNAMYCYIHGLPEEALDSE